jgi:uncharacterized membrane protein YhaH (DUF805 family)
MTFQESVQSCLVRNYANFQGRAARPEFWWFMLAITVAGLIAGLIDGFAFGGREILVAIVGLGTVVPSLAVGARRLHDIDRTGWWQLLSILLIGTLVLIFFWVQPGTPGPNRYGAPPAA